MSSSFSTSFSISQLQSPELLLQTKHFSSADRERYLQLLHEMIPLEVRNHHSGRVETYYLYFQDPSLIEEYRGTLYKESDGRVYSTLCGVALDEDNLVWHLSASEFHSLYATLTSESVTKSIDETVTQTERATAHSLQQQIFTRIFPPSTLSSLIAGVQYFDSTTLAEFSAWLIEELHNTRQPIRFLEHVLSHIKADSFTQAWQELRSLEKIDISRPTAQGV